MIINRDRYLKQLTAKKWNGKIKVVTGLRRCGKSFLLNTLFVEHLDRGTYTISYDCNITHTGRFLNRTPAVN